jgi:AcrR family transcriptional regulator
MGYRHTKAEILEGALTVAFADGLSQLTYGRVARNLDINDRIVVYYFPSKEDLVSEVLVSVGMQLQQALEPAFTSPADGHLELVQAAWPIMASAEADPIFALFLEASGLAASGREPYRTLVPQLVEIWITWTAEFINGASSHRRTEAEASIAILDGLLLLRQMAGDVAADRAAKAIGVYVRK